MTSCGWVMQEFITRHRLNLVAGALYNDMFNY